MTGVPHCTRVVEPSNIIPKRLPGKCNPGRRFFDSAAERTVSGGHAGEPGDFLPRQIIEQGNHAAHAHHSQHRAQSNTH